MQSYSCTSRISDVMEVFPHSESRLNSMPTKGLPHGFGLGTGTVAEGWIEDAVRFWESQLDNR